MHHFVNEFRYRQMIFRCRNHLDVPIFNSWLSFYSHRNTWNATRISKWWKLNCIFAVHLDRVALPSTARPTHHERERKPVLYSHYTHHRHSSSSSSSVDKIAESNNIYRPFLHAIKAQRHSDPYSIKWITEGPHRDSNDPGRNFNWIFSYLVRDISF